MGSKTTGSGRKKRKRSDATNQSESAKSDACREGLLFPAAACAPLPQPDVVRKADAATQDIFVNKAAALCERIVVSMDSGIATLSPAPGPVGDERGTSAGIEDTILADMARLRGVPVAREYVDISLWRWMRSANGRVLAAIDAACAIEGSTAAGPTLDGTVSRPVSFKEMHLERMTNDFSRDLAKLHEVEEMDGKQVQFLLRCLEEGADLFEHLRL